MTGIERLRKLSEDLFPHRLWNILVAGTEEDWDCHEGDFRTVSDELLDIANQIEREQDVETVRADAMEAWRWVRRRGGLATLQLHEETFADMMRQRNEYRDLAREYEREATWVRDQGGLDEVRRRWKYLSHYADPVPRSCMERRLARLQRQIDESHAALRRRNQRIAVLASEINREHNENRMEFLRRAGNYTAFADEVCERLAPQLRPDLPDQLMSEPGERVKRPALDAEGNRIEPAMDVWWVCEGDERGIHAEKLHVESIGEDGLVTCDPFNGGTWVELEPSELYVKKPALDADGVLCREGDEVWEVRSHRRREIVATHYLDYETGEPLILCDGDDAIPIPATCVTHTKPEPPDSWERIEEDAGKDRCSYFGAKYQDCGRCTQLATSCSISKSRDLVRRCKALAERG